MKNSPFIFIILVTLINFLLVGCYKPMNPDFFQGTCEYAIDEHGRETLTVKGINLESIWGVSSIEEETYSDRINLKTTVQYRGGYLIDRTIDVGNACRVMLNGKTIWESEPYRKAFMGDDFYELFFLQQDKVPMPEKFTRIPSPVMRRMVLEWKSVSKAEIDQIDLLLELSADIHPLWSENPALALKIINRTPLKELSESERLYLLNSAIISGTSETAEAILNSGIDVAHGFFHRRCSIRKEKKTYWQNGVKQEGKLPMQGCFFGTYHSHGLVKDAIQTRNLAVAELFIKRGAPYSNEEKDQLEKMRATPLEYLPKINTLARLEALLRAGVAVDDPRMGLNDIHKPPLETMPDLLNGDWRCTTGRLIQLKYLLDHGAKQGLKELFDWGLKNDKFAVVFLAGNASDQTKPAASEREIMKMYLPRLIRRMLEAKRNLNQPAYGRESASTLLTEVARLDCFEAVRLLVEHRADVNLKALGGETPLFCALRNGNVEMVKYLLDHGAKIQSPEDILVAGHSGSVKLIKLLLERGENLHIKAHHRTLLLTAVYSGDLELVCFLVEKQNFPVNENVPDVWKSPLYAATSQNGCLELFDYLLSKGASFDPQSKDALQFMHNAAQWGHASMIKRLAELGVPVNDVFLGNTPLHWAAFRGYEEATKVLLALGADPNLKNHMGLTVLEFAAKSKGTEKARQIIKTFAEKSPWIQFRLVSPDYRNELAERTTKAPPDGTEWIQNRQNGEWILVEKKSLNIAVVSDIQKFQKDYLSLVVTLYPEDAARFHELTRENIDRQLAVFVQGDYCCAPVIRAPIPGGQIQITGVPDMDEVLEKFKSSLKKIPSGMRENVPAR